MLSAKSIFIVEVIDNGDKFEYEYGNIRHAEEHYNNEKSANLYEYNNGNHYFIKGKLI